MKIRNQTRRCTALLLAVLLLTSCGGGGTEAASMRLMRTEGEVGVSDDAGKSVAPRDNLGLYSGYGVDTQSASFAWINLDDVKLTKMDEKSEIAIQKDGKHLEIEIRSGSLFFNVTEPLEADETMNIRTSTMAIGIRGTCGWVEVPDAGHMDVYLLEGKVECSVAGETVMVSAGETGRLDETAGTVTVEPFGQDAIPGFVQGELEGIPLDGIPETIEPSSETEQGPTADAMEQYRAIVGQAASYDYGAIDPPTGTYRYALVPMRASYEVPALLLEQDTRFGLSYAVAFQYEPDIGQAIQASGNMMEGVAQVGGFRGSLLAAGDGNGVLSWELSSGTGMGSTSRITLNGNALQSTTLWSGNVFDDTDTTGEEIGFLDIDWHDIADLSGLGGQIAAIPASQPEAGQLPTDGDRIVFTGTIDTYTYDGVLALQGIPDPNPGSSQYMTAYRIQIIVLDTPQTMNLKTGDGQGYMDGIVTMIGTSGYEQYDGQHLIFSIDPSETWWPSGTDLPLGEPGTDDIHVLGPAPSN